MKRAEKRDSRRECKKEGKDEENQRVEDREEDAMRKSSNVRPAFHQRAHVRPPYESLPLETKTALFRQVRFYAKVSRREPLITVCLRDNESTSLTNSDVLRARECQ